MFRFAGIAILITTLGGCGLAARKEREEAFAAAKVENEAAIAACQEHYPPNQMKDHVGKAQCVNDAMKIMRPFAPYPDLMDQDMANRSMLAERVQQGKMSAAEATAEMSQRRSAIVAEEQRRNLSNRSVSAQESAAAAAWKGTSCTRIGNTVNCY